MGGLTPCGRPPTHTVHERLSSKDSERLAPLRWVSRSKAAIPCSRRTMHHKVRHGEWDSGALSAMGRAFVALGQQHMSQHKLGTSESSYFSILHICSL